MKVDAEVPMPPPPPTVGDVLWFNVPKVNPKTRKAEGMEERAFVVTEVCEGGRFYMRPR